MNKENNLSFSEVFLENNELIYKYIFLRTGFSKEIAEDLSQEVFFKALKNFNNYNKNQSNIRTWLFTIARNIIIDFYRSNKHKTVDIELTQDLLVVEESYRELTELVVSKLKVLKNAEQEIIIYKYVYEFSDEEISKIIRKSNGATRILIHRTIKKLKEIINKK